MLTQQRTTTRFRCGHCGNRLVMHDRHLRRLVACHACGRGTHPLAKRLAAEQPRVEAAQSSGGAAAKPQAAVARPQAAIQTESPRVGAPAILELSAAPLASILLVGAAGFGFFVAISLMSYVGGFVSALVLVALAAMGVRWIRRGTLSVRARLDQIETIRLRCGVFRVVAMLFAWIRAQPAARRPWACLLMVFWGMLYAPYCLRAMLLPTSRGRGTEGATTGRTVLRPVIRPVGV